ncbi:MAG: NAD-binding protein [Candidatus Micrarchaeia archaeon]
MDELKELKDHVIVCGYGAVGTEVVEVVASKGIKVVIIDIDPAKIKKAEELGYLTIEGDATSSKILKKAGIEYAKAIAIVMDNDAKDLFAVLTARSISKSIFIATRANDEFVKQKLVEAGADFIVMPEVSATKEIIKEIKRSS